MFTYCFALLQSMKTDRKGVTALEYGLLAGLIAVVIIAGATASGHDREYVVRQRCGQHGQRLIVPNTTASSLPVAIGCEEPLSFNTVAATM